MGLLGKAKAALKSLAWNSLDLFEGHGSRVITFNARPKSGPWGGGNQWLHSMVKALKKKGWSVNYKLGPKTKLAFIVNTKGLTETNPSARIQNGITFGLEEVQEFKRSHPRVPFVQRINDSDAHRNSNHIDKAFASVNALMDYTIFNSPWVRAYHFKWFRISRPHAVITPGADSQTYYPDLKNEWRPGEKLIVVTHHWSNHMSKGFDWYQVLDKFLAVKKFQDIEFRIIGNVPPELTWKYTKIIAPLHGAALANELRQCHVYFTASQFEAAPMHVIEGLQCGLPPIFHKNGGGVCDSSRPYGVEFESDLMTALLEMKRRYPELRQKLLKSLPNEEKMNESYLKVIEKLSSQTPSKIVVSERSL